MNEGLPIDRVKVVIQNARLLLKRRYGTQPLWVMVRDLCGLGSQSAVDLCRAVGFDPHQPCSAKRLVAPRSHRFGRLPSEVGKCPGCNGPLDYFVDGGDERGDHVSLTCVNNCDEEGLQMDWQPILDRARKWVNETR